MKKKIRIASVINLLGISRLLISFQHCTHFPYIRVVNYHSTNERFEANLEKQLQYFSKIFIPADVDDLGQLLGGNWPHERPGLLLSFDDGLRDNFAIAVPLLEKYGFKGLFFIPPGFVDEPVQTANEFCVVNKIDGSEALTIEEVQYLARYHHIGCHTFNHTRLEDSLTSQELSREIVDSKKRLEEMTSKVVNNFAWVGGEESSYGKNASKLIQKSGFKYCFMTNSLPVTKDTHPFWLQRTNIEASWPMSLVQFQISGIPDIWNWAKRRRICKYLDSSKGPGF